MGDINFTNSLKGVNPIATRCSASFVPNITLLPNVQGTLACNPFV